MDNNYFDRLGQWIRSVPLVTRTWLLSTVIITALANMNLVDPNSLYLNQWNDIWSLRSRIEAWRLITCFLYAGKFGWRILIGLHLMFEISTRYEVMGPICTRVRLRVQGANESSTRTENDTNGQPIPSDQPGLRQIEYYPRGESSDYAFALLLGILAILLSKFFLLPYLPYSITQNQHHVFFHRHLTFFVVYIWSKQHPDRNVNLFGVQMTAAYLPFAYLIIGYALNNGQTIPVDMLHGMFVGHLYFYLACVVPKVMRGRVIIVTPLWMVDLCNWLEGRGGLIFGGGGWEGNNPMLVDVDGVIGG